MTYAIARERYKPNNLATMNSVNINVNLLINGEENHLSIHEPYLEIDFMFSDHAGPLLANGDNVRIVNYCVLSLFSSIRLETISGKTNE